MCVCVCVCVCTAVYTIYVICQPCACPWCVQIDHCEERSADLDSFWGIADKTAGTASGRNNTADLFQHSYRKHKATLQAKAVYE